MKQLKVPYYNQYNFSSGSGWRECYSAVGAMIAAFHGKVRNQNQYNKIRQRFGDSTSADAQLQTLRHLGLNPIFGTNGGGRDIIKSVIDAGLPIGLGVLHRGYYTQPYGGGHWILAVGYDDTNLTVHDPSGDMDLTYGGFVNYTDGAYQKYSWKRTMPRWRVDGTGGWYLYAKA